MRHGTVQFIAVGTPPDEDGSADLRYVVAAARSIGRHMTRLPRRRRQVHRAGRHRRPVREAIAEELQRARHRVPFSVVSNPEFLKEGAAVEDFMKPDRVVIGSDDERATQIMRALYAPFQRNHERMLVMDVRSAELTKYAANAMLATRISFMNELANLAEKLGADIEQVRQGIGSDPRIGYHFLYAGRRLRRLLLSEGRAGRCSARPAQDGVPLRILQAVEEANEAQKQRAAAKGHGAVRREPRRPALRAVGPRVQAEYRRHARSAQPRGHRRAARARRARSAPTIPWRWRRRSASFATSRA